MSVNAIAPVGNSNSSPPAPATQTQKTDVAGVVAQAAPEQTVKKHDVAGILAFGAMPVPPEGTRDLAIG